MGASARLRHFLLRPSGLACLNTVNSSAKIRCTPMQRRRRRRPAGRGRRACVGSSAGRAPPRPCQTLRPFLRPPHEGGLDRPHRGLIMRVCCARYPNREAVNAMPCARDRANSRPENAIEANSKPQIPLHRQVSRTMSRCALAWGPRQLRSLPLGADGPANAPGECRVQADGTSPCSGKSQLLLSGRATPRIAPAGACERPGSKRRLGGKRSAVRAGGGGAVAGGADASSMPPSRQANRGSISPSRCSVQPSRSHAPPSSGGHPSMGGHRAHTTPPLLLLAAALLAATAAAAPAPAACGRVHAADYALEQPALLSSCARNASAACSPRCRQSIQRVCAPPPCAPSQRALRPLAPAVAVACSCCPCGRLKPLPPSPPPPPRSWAASA